MALPCFMLTFCIPLLLTGIWDRHLRIPFRVSSLPPRQLLPPLTYTITEDIVAVDGGGGLAFRQAWRHRYEASRVIRRLCRVTAVVWGASGCVIATALLAAAWTAPTDTAYGLGYGIPWLWAMVLSAWTVKYVRDCLRKESDEWETSKVHKEMELHLVEKDIDREVDKLQRMRSIASAVSTIDQRELDKVAREGRTRRLNTEPLGTRISGEGRRSGLSDEVSPTRRPRRPRVSIEDNRGRRGGNATTPKTPIAQRPGLCPQRALSTGTDGGSREESIRPRPPSDRTPSSVMQAV